jgi:hypothetical protein
MSGPLSAPSWSPAPVVSARIILSPKLGDGGQNITLCFKAVDSADQAALRSVPLEQAVVSAELCVHVLVVSCIYR